MYICRVGITWCEDAMKLGVGMRLPRTDGQIYRGIEKLVICASRHADGE